MFSFLWASSGTAPPRAQEAPVATVPTVAEATAMMSEVAIHENSSTVATTPDPASFVAVSVAPTPVSPKAPASPSSSTASSATTSPAFLRGTPRLVAEGIYPERDEFVRFVVSAGTHDVTVLRLLWDYITGSPDETQVAARLAELLRCNLLTLLDIHLQKPRAPSICLDLLLAIADSPTETHARSLLERSSQILPYALHWLRHWIRQGGPPDGRRSSREPVKLLRILSTLAEVGATSTALTARWHPFRSDFASLQQQLTAHWLPQLTSQHAPELIMSILRTLCISFVFGDPEDQQRQEAPTVAQASTTLAAAITEVPSFPAVFHSVTQLLLALPDGEHIELQHWLITWLSLQFDQGVREKALLATLDDSKDRILVRFQQLLHHPGVWVETKCTVALVLSELAAQPQPVCTQWILDTPQLILTAAHLLFEGESSELEEEATSQFVESRNNLHWHLSLLLNNIAAGSEEHQKWLFMWAPPQLEQRRRRSSGQPSAESSHERSVKKLAQPRSWIISQATMMLQEPGTPLNVKINLVWMLSGLLSSPALFAYAELMHLQLMSADVPTVLMRDILFSGSSDAFNLATQMMHAMWWEHDSVRRRMQQWLYENVDDLLLYLEPYPASTTAPDTTGILDLFKTILQRRAAAVLRSARPSLAARMPAQGDAGDVTPEASEDEQVESEGDEEFEEQKHSDLAQ
jgi:hypothetical protein